MPFDSLTLSPEQALPIAASRAGLGMLDLGQLERHKAAELERHPPGWAFCHRTPLRLAFGIATILGFVGFVGFEAAGLAIPAFVLAASLCALLALAFLMPMRGPAYWEERQDLDLNSVHPQVAYAARRLKEELPHVQFRVGELYQERVMLDPYLVAEHAGARLLLGIWDGQALIACA